MKYRTTEQRYRKEMLKKGPTKMTLQTQLRMEEEQQVLQDEINEKTLALGDTQESAQDWHDNAAWDSLKQELDVLDTSLVSFQAALENPEIINPREEVDTVQLGNTVVVRYEDEEEDETFTILGPFDSGTNESWISEESALAEALIGLQSGSVATMTNGLTVKLVEILPGDF